MILFDSHCHMDDEKFQTDREQLINNILESKKYRLITAGYSLESSKKAIEIAKEHIRNICYCTEYHQMILIKM